MKTRTRKCGPLIHRCKLTRLYLAKNRYPEPDNDSPTEFVRQMTGDGIEWTILEVISRELRIKKMLIKLKTECKVADIITHLKETFKMLNIVDYYIKEVVDKSNLDSELNKELNIRMPIINITSKVVLLCKKQYADSPAKPPAMTKMFSYENTIDRFAHKKSSPDIYRKTKPMGNELVSVS